MFNSCYNLRDKINFKVFHSQYGCVNWTNSILTEEVDMGFPKQELYECTCYIYFQFKIFISDSCAMHVCVCVFLFFLKKIFLLLDFYILSTIIRNNTFPNCIYIMRSVYSLEYIPKYFRIKDIYKM